MIDKKKLANRPPVPAHVRFQEHADELRERGIEEIFSYIYRTNLWGSDESLSGVGSEFDATQHLQTAIPALLRQLRAEVLLDIPCGDFGWLSRAALEVEYIGADIVEELVARNTARYADPESKRHFIRRDLTCDLLPRADVVLCRDCLVHLAYDHIFQAFANLKRSGSTYLLVTTFTELDTNQNIENGDWRPLNLQLPPFNLPDPAAVIVEGCTEEGGAYADKALALWEIATLPERPADSR